MNGMIFAAGLGTRLAPLTNSRPKALVEVLGQTLLERAILHMTDAKIRNIVVNVHHMADMIEDFILSHRSEWQCDIVISDERDELLDTGGGIAKALNLFTDTNDIVVRNADIITNASINSLVEYHKASNADATLLTDGRTSSRALLFDSDGRLSGWKNKKSGETKTPRIVKTAYEEAFDGIHVISQRCIRKMLPVRKMGIIDAYLDMAADTTILRKPIADGEYWFDIGTTEKLATAESFLSNLK
jgi:NDP-sugar pyrophosphorylase family protein